MLDFFYPGTYPVRTGQGYIRASGRAKSAYTQNPYLLSLRNLTRHKYYVKNRSGHVEVPPAARSGIRHKFPKYNIKPHSNRCFSFGDYSYFKHYMLYHIPPINSVASAWIFHLPAGNSYLYGYQRTPAGIYIPPPEYEKPHKRRKRPQCNEHNRSAL